MSTIEDNLQELSFVADDLYGSDLWPSELADRWAKAVDAIRTALSAGGGEAVAWQVRRTDGSPLAVWESCTRELYDLTLATGRYSGFENGPPCEVRALGVIGGAGGVPAGWKPIETAPRDATAILVMRDIWPGTKSGRAEECNGHNTYVAQWWAGERGGAGAWICYMNATQDPECPVDPTHWMPLPAPPSASPRALHVGGEPDLHDFVTHRASWRKAIENLAEQDESGYWQHELEAYDKAMIAFDAAHPKEGDQR